MYVTAGEATYITGGKLVNSEQNSPGEWLGGTILGEAHSRTQGAAIVVPPGMPALADVEPSIADSIPHRMKGKRQNRNRAISWPDRGLVPNPLKLFTNPKPAESAPPGLP